MTEQRTEDVQAEPSESSEPTMAAPASTGAAETPSAVTPDTAEETSSTPGGAAEAQAVVAGGVVADSAPAEQDEDRSAENAHRDEHTDGEAASAADPAVVEGVTAGTADSGRAAGRPGDRRKQLEKEGEVAADFLETLLDICDLDGDIDVDIDGDRAAVAIVDSDEGRVPRRLVGQDANVLEALQELTRLAVQSETGERSRLMLDIAGHRADRRSTLVKLAQDAIAEVQSSGESSSLSPMSAFERKVVHDEVLAAGLHSESEGSEPRRYVVISPAG